MCEEYETLQHRTGKPAVGRGSRVPQSCQAWSRQKCFWIVMTVLTKIFYCSNMENELKSCHNKTNWANFVRMQGFLSCLKSDSISWRKTLQISHNSQMQWLVVSTLCQETKIHLNQTVGSEGSLKFGPYWKLQYNLFVWKVNIELRSELCLYSAWRMCVEIECEWFCMPIKGQSKTTKTRTCRFFHKNNAYLGKNLDRSLNQENIQSPIVKCRRNWFIFFVMKVLESKRLSSGSFCGLSSLVWRQVEEKHGKRMTNQENDTSVFRAFSRLLSSTFIMSDAINLHSIINSGWCRGGSEFEQQTDSILYACESYG